MRVIVGIDGSETGWRALKFAANMAKAYNGGLDVMAVIDLGQLDFYDGMYLTPEQVDGLQDKVKKEVLDEARSHIPDEVTDVNLEIGRGVVAKVLVDRADTVGDAIIVVGRAGRNLIERFTVGSVSRKLAQASPVPVVVVP